jgi:hypothetical protein
VDHRKRGEGESKPGSPGDAAVQQAYEYFNARLCSGELPPMAQKRQKRGDATYNRSIKLPAAAPSPSWRKIFPEKEGGGTKRCDFQSRGRV